MRRKFAANLIFLFAANLLIKPFWILGIDRVVQNQLGAEVYGTYFAVFNYSFLFSILLDFGINNFNNRAIARNNQRAGEYLMNLLVLKFFLGLLYFGFTFLTAISAGYSEVQMKMLLFLAINQLLLSFILYLRSNIAALQFFKTDSFISILDRLLAICFCLVLMYSFQSFEIMWFIYAQTLALFLTTVVAFTVVLFKSRIQTKLWEVKFTRKILIKSMPFALLALLMGIYYRVDGVMLERMLPNGAQEAGIYAASFRLLDAFNQVGFLFATLLLPMFAGMIRRNESVHDLVKFGGELMFGFASITSITCYFFRSEMIHLLYPNANEYWASIYGWLLLNFVPMSSVYIFGTLLTAKGSLKTLNYLALAGVLVNVVINFLLIPSYGAWGATMATLITQSLVAILHIVIAYRQFRFSFNTNDFLRLSGFFVASVLVTFLLSSSPFSWGISFSLALIACCLLALLMKLIPSTPLLSLVNAKGAS